MADTARLTRHPRDPRSVLLHINAAHNSLMGLFAPARLAPELKAYVIHEDNVPGLATHLRIKGISLVDDRNAVQSAGSQKCRVCGDKHEPASGPLPECATCQQPASRYHPPTRCPNCGQPWIGVTFTETSGLDWRPDPRICAECGTENRLAFPRCHSCGAELPPMRSVASRPAETRPHLNDPIPVGEAIAEWIDGQQPNEEAT